MFKNIPLHHLHPDPRNANVCDTETMDTIARLIQRTGLCPHPIVRPHPTESGQYMIVDGHHRWQILQKLGWTSVDCQVWEMDEQEAALALATLNRVQGTDDLYRRAQLVEELTHIFSVEELATLLPESEREIQDLLALLHLDLEAAEALCRREMEEEEALLPVPLGFMVSKAGALVIEQALAPYVLTAKDRGEALVALCQKALEVRDA
jgi:ParB/RepB/Spo0J family partition protein